MNLTYKGINHRKRDIWIDEDYYDESRPEHFVLEEWQIPRYRDLVETAESCMGRKLTKEEARTMEWLSGMEKETCNHIAKFIREAHQNNENCD